MFTEKTMILSVADWKLYSSIQNAKILSALRTTITFAINDTNNGKNEKLNIDEIHQKYLKFLEGILPFSFTDMTEQEYQHDIAGRISTILLKISERIHETIVSN